MGVEIGTILIMFLAVPHCLIEKIKFIKKTKMKGDKDITFSLKL